MSEIREAIKAVYRKKKHHKELGALEALMSDRVLRGIAKELESSLRHEKNYDQRVFVDVAWIDKIPLAHFREDTRDINGLLIEQKVEVGDLLIQRTHSQMSSPHDATVFRNLSLVMQAKVTKSSAPEVPISVMSKTNVSSTSKELALLEHWPPIDLYETSASRCPIIEDIMIDADEKHSYYGAFIDPQQEWQFGQARYQQVCDMEFHELIYGLGSGAIGANAGDDGQWAVLTQGILRSATNRKIPQHLNSKLRNRIQTAKAQIAGISLAPLLEIFCPRSKMAVLMIDQVDFEGHDISKLISQNFR